jgi:hypothetical protein
MRLLWGLLRVLRLSVVGLAVLFEGVYAGSRCAGKRSIAVGRHRGVRPGPANVVAHVCAVFTTPNKATRAVATRARRL